MTIDTSTEAVERLLEDVTPGPWAWNESHPTNACAHVTAAIDGGWPFELATLFGESDDVPSPTEPDEPWGDHPIRRANARFIAAARDLVPALLKERDEAVDAKLDALSTLDAWFDRRKLGNEAVNQAVIDAASGYLRTSRVGGMPQVESDLILGVMQDMSRLGLFADIFARAMNDMVPALLKERDDLRARIDELEAFITDFASAKFDSLPQPYIRHPADEPDPVTEATTVWAWQEDAKGLLKGETK